MSWVPVFLPTPSGDPEVLPASQEGDLLRLESHPFRSSFAIAGDLIKVKDDGSVVLVEAGPSSLFRMSAPKEEVMEVLRHRKVTHRHSGRIFVLEETVDEGDHWRRGRDLELLAREHGWAFERVAVRGDHREFAAGDLLEHLRAARFWSRVSYCRLTIDLPIGKTVYVGIVSRGGHLLAEVEGWGDFRTVTYRCDKTGWKERVLQRLKKYRPRD